MRTLKQAHHHARVCKLVARITTPENRGLRVGMNEFGMTYIQAGGFVQDLTDPLNPGPRSWQVGGKSYISEHAVDNEIVSCCLALLLAFDEHETREAFLFDGARIYGPHIQLDALAGAAPFTEVRA